MDDAVSAWVAAARPHRPCCFCASCVILVPADSASIIRDIECFVQMVGANLVPTSLQTQNLITETLLELLASDHVFLIRLTNVDEITSANGTSIARMTYIMQKNTETSPISVVCLLSCARSFNAVMQLSNPCLNGTKALLHPRTTSLLQVRRHSVHCPRFMH